MISIFTATHDTRFLSDLYSSIMEQTNPNWEWVLVPNGNIKNADLKSLFIDERVKVFPLSIDVDRVRCVKKIRM